MTFIFGLDEIEFTIIKKKHSNHNVEATFRKDFIILSMNLVVNKNLQIMSSVDATAIEINNQIETAKIVEKALDKLLTDSILKII